MARYDLARFRREHCLTQKQLAEALSVTQGFLSSVENGRTPFPEERRKDFEKAFPGVNLNDYRSLDDVAEEVKEWEPQQRRGFLAQIHQTINQLVSVYDGDDDIDDDKPTASEAGLGFGGMRQPHVTPTDEAALTSDENVPENWRKEVAKVLTENRELENKIAKYANINEQDTKDYAILYNKIENIEEYCQDIINASHVNDNDKYIAENIMQIIRGKN